MSNENSNQNGLEPNQGQSKQQENPLNQQSSNNNPTSSEEVKGPSQIQAQMLMQEEQQKIIREQVQAQSSLIGDLLPLALLMDQFCNNEGFYIKIQNMMGVYESYRKTRRDGSCFYRALNFNIFEKIVLKNNKALLEHFVKKIKSSKEHMLKANFEAIVFEDVLDLFIEKLTTKLPKNESELLELFRNPEDSNYMVLILRFITSSEIKNNAILYQTFIDDQIPVQIYCQQQVQPIDKEADQIPIMALLNYLEVGIRIVYLDSNKSKQAYKVILPECFKEQDIVGEVLYRPGHYDILYK